MNKNKNDINVGWMALVVAIGLSAPLIHAGDITNGLNGLGDKSEGSSVINSETNDETTITGSGAAFKNDSRNSSMGRTPTNSGTTYRTPDRMPARATVGVGNMGGSIGSEISDVNVAVLGGRPVSGNTGMNGGGTTVGGGEPQPSNPSNPVESNPTITEAPTMELASPLDRDAKGLDRDDAGSQKESAFRKLR